MIGIVDERILIPVAWRVEHLSLSLDSTGR
jgi:hypothetical protein